MHLNHRASVWVGSFACYCFDSCLACLPVLAAACCLYQPAASGCHHCGIARWKKLDQWVHLRRLLGILRSYRGFDGAQGLILGLVYWFQAWTDDHGHDCDLGHEVVVLVEEEEAASYRFEQVVRDEHLKVLRWSMQEMACLGPGQSF